MLSSLKKAARQVEEALNITENNEDPAFKARLELLFVTQKEFEKLRKTINTLSGDVSPCLMFYVTVLDPIMTLYKVYDDSRLSHAVALKNWQEKSKNPHVTQAEVAHALQKANDIGAVYFQNRTNLDAQIATLLATRLQQHANVRQAIINHLTTQVTTFEQKTG